MTTEDIQWVPKYVLWEGKLYPAPLNVLGLLYQQELLRLLKERAGKR